MGIILVLRSAKSQTANYPPSYGQICDVTALKRKERPGGIRSNKDLFANVSLRSPLSLVMANEHDREQALRGYRYVPLQSHSVRNHNPMKLHLRGGCQ